MKYRPTPFLLLFRRIMRTIEGRGLSGAAVDTFGRLFRYIRNHGVGGTIKHLVSGAPMTMPPAQEQAMPRKPHPFDLLHGTDTGGYSSGGDFSAVSLSAIYTTAYFGTTPSACKQALSALPVKFEDYTFVDIGCGKGRALLIAAQFPFRHLLGVELSSDLCTIARANIATDPRNIERVSIVNQDAIKLAYPEGPLVLFLFDPFVAPVLRRVLANLERQLRRSPRPAYLLYEWHPRTPGITKVIDSFAFMKEISDTPYTFSPEDAAFDPFQRTEENFTLYSINGTH